MKAVWSILLVISLAAFIGLEFYPLRRTLVQRMEAKPSLNRQYSEDTLLAFLDHNFGSEYGSEGRVVRKWNSAIRIKIHGEANIEDLQFLRKTVDLLANILANPAISIVGDDENEANIHIHFIPRAEFSSVIPQYKQKSGGLSFFWWGHWNSDSQLTKATLLLDPRTHQKRTQNQILRLLIAALGVNLRYGDSVTSVMSDWSLTEFSDTDIELLQLLYEPLIIPGMTKAQAQERLQQEETFAVED